MLHSVETIPRCGWFRKKEVGRIGEGGRECNMFLWSFKKNLRSGEKAGRREGECPTANKEFPMSKWGGRGAQSDFVPPSPRLRRAGRTMGSCVGWGFARRAGVERVDRGLRGLHGWGGKGAGGALRAEWWRIGERGVGNEFRDGSEWEGVWQDPPTPLCGLRRGMPSLRPSWLRRT